MEKDQVGKTLGELRLAREELEQNLTIGIGFALEKWHKQTGGIQIKGINAIFENVREMGKRKEFVFAGCYVDIDFGLGEI
jgi:hypothetical protein